MTLKRVLIVDDEHCVLSGLRRQLHVRRAEWELLFVDGGERALELLASQPADVLVTDMRMPGMDGAQLLDRVAQSHPRVARLVLSGQAERERQLAARGCCHRYLTKPCPAEQLEGAVRQALAVREALDQLSWAEGDRLWNCAPGDDTATATLLRLLTDDGHDGALAVLGALHQSDARLRERVESVLGGPAAGEDSASPGAQGGGLALIALTMAVLLHARVAGEASVGAAALTAARTLAAGRALRLPAEEAHQAATAALLDLPGPGRNVRARSQALDFLLPIWGFPAPVIAAAAALHDPAAPSTGLLALLRQTTPRMALT